MSEYTPEDPDAYGRMLTFLRTVETEADLKEALLLYIFDMSYPRVDILMAEKLIRKEKGWRAGLAV